MNKEIADLVVEIQKGNNDAFNKLYVMKYGEYYNYTLKRLNDSLDTQEVVQDLYCRISKYIHSLKSVDSFESWSYKILNNLINDKYESNSRIKIPTYSSNDIDIEDVRKDKVPNKAARIEYDKEKFNTFIGELSEKQQEVVDMFYIKGLSISEISKKTGLNENTIKSRLGSAKKKLVRSINEYEEEEGSRMFSYGTYKKKKTRLPKRFLKMLVQ